MILGITNAFKIWILPNKVRVLQCHPFKLFERKSQCFIEIKFLFFAQVVSDKDTKNLNDIIYLLYVDLLGINIYVITPKPKSFSFLSARLQTRANSKTTQCQGRTFKGFDALNKSR